jgi:hypothetical protein
MDRNKLINRILNTETGKLLGKEFLDKKCILHLQGLYSAILSRDYENKLKVNN